MPQEGAAKPPIRSPFLSCATNAPQLRCPAAAAALSRTHTCAWSDPHRAASPAPGSKSHVRGQLTSPQCQPAQYVAWAAVGPEGRDMGKGMLPVSEEAPWNASFEMQGAGSGPLSGPWYRTHEAQLLGVLLAAASNFLISVSLSIQKCTHLQLACQAEPKPYYTSSLWWCGVTLLGLGEVGNFTAYGFAPIALVAPVGCVAVIGSAFISAFFLKRTMRAADILGGTLAVTGTCLLVTFAPTGPQELTARRVQNYLVSWPFLLYMILEIITFCVLLYFYKRKAVKHIVVLLMMVALLASLSVVAVKAVASMTALSVRGKMQLTYPVFYIMIVLMVTSCAFQVKFLNQATHLYEVTAVVPINFVLFTISAIISGVVFYREFQSAAPLSLFMFLLGCLLAFLGVFVIARNQQEGELQLPFIDCGSIPGQKLTGKIQPDSPGPGYGTWNNEDDAVKSGLKGESTLPAN